MKSKFSIALALGVCSVAAFMSIVFPSMEYFVDNNIKIINDYIEYYNNVDDTDYNEIQSDESSSCSVVGKNESVGENDEEPGECVEGKPTEPVVIDA
jgi:hypothetical protein